VHPRALSIPGADHPKVVSYIDVLRRTVEVGARVAIIGAGGIGFDVAAFLAHDDGAHGVDGYLDTWGVDRAYSGRGALKAPREAVAARDVTLCQRSAGKPGAKLGKTTGWIHRATLQKLGVKALSGVTYQRVDDAGLHVLIDGRSLVLEVDHVVVCAGQEPNRAHRGRRRGVRARRPARDRSGHSGRRGAVASTCGPSRPVLCTCA
jgi:2,4-dienoyl-CoA reductase (NADPH2)